MILKFILECMGCVGVDWIQLFQRGVQCMALRKSLSKIWAIS